MVLFRPCLPDPSTVGPLASIPRSPTPSPWDTPLTSRTLDAFLSGNSFSGFAVCSFSSSHQNGNQQDSSLRNVITLTDVAAPSL